MAVSERERRKLLEALVGTIGPEPTDTLLGYLPPVGWADVATKRDLDAVSAALRGEIRRLDDKIDALEGRLNSKIDSVEARLVGKIDALAGRLDGEIEALNGRIDALDAHLNGRIDALGGKLDGVAGTLEAKVERGFKVLVFWMVSLQIAAVGAILGVPALLHR